MVTMRRFATEFYQGNGKNIAEWTDLNNLNTDAETYAICNDITKGSSPNNKPAKIELTKFNFIIPKGAIITAVRIGYEHYYTGNLNIAAPLFKLIGGYGSAYGTSVPNTSTDYKVYRENNKLTIEEVTNPGFGVSIEYPANTSNQSGDLLLKYVWIEIDYTLPTYFLSGNVSNPTPATGEQFNLSLKIENTNNSNNGLYLTFIDIQLPSSISFLEGKGEGQIIVQDGKLIWSTLLTDNPSIMNLKLQAVGDTGEYNILINEESTGTNITEVININAPILNYTLSCENVYINPTKLTNNEYNFNIKITSTSRPYNLQPLTITLPSNWNFLEATLDSTKGNIERTEKNNIFIWNTSLEDGVENATIKVKIPSTPGQQTIQIQDQIFTCYIIDPNYSIPFYSFIKLDTNTLEKLSNGVQYTVASYMKVLERDNSVIVYTGNLNYRFGICQEEEFDINKCKFTDIIPHWNRYIREELDFIYDENKPVFLVWTGGYVENTPEKMDILFTEPCIVEKEYYTGLIERALFPEPLQNLLKETDTSTLILPAQTDSGRIRFSDINFSGLETIKNIVIQGIQINFYIGSNLSSIFNTILYASLSSFQTKTENIPVNDGMFSLGSDNDIWNFNHNDLTNFKDLFFDIIIKNPYNYPLTLNLRNFYLDVGYIDDTNLEAKGFSINYDQCQYYGIFLSDRDLGHGVNSTLKEHREDGSDFAIEYLMNVKDKTIQLDCLVNACSHDEAMILIEKFVKLVSNERDKNNKPIYKQLRLDDMPGRYWNYILKDEIEDSIDHGQHKLKIKFFIPDGCAYSNDLTVTGSSGKITSIEKVNPIILLRVHSNEITLNETKSNQTLSIRNNSIVDTDTVRINCQKRTVERVISDTVSYDITSSVDLNSDFFSLMGDYNFDAGKTATIQSVTYREAL